MTYLLESIPGGTHLSANHSGIVSPEQRHNTTVSWEFLFQAIAECAEKAAVIVTTNMPFSEWTQVIPNAQLCKALLDRITDRAHIIETGTESYRFRRTVKKGKGRTPAVNQSSGPVSAERKTK